MVASAPHFGQYCMPAGTAVKQLGHAVRASAAPQYSQRVALSGGDAPQLGQVRRAGMRVRTDGPAAR